MPLEFSVNVDSGSIETALVSVFDPTRPIEISEFVINDSLELTFSFVDATGTPQFWSGDLAYDVRVALGEPGAVPANGTFVLLDDGGASTPEFPTNTNAQTLEDALNALNGDTGPDGAQVDVTRSYNGLYIVKRRVAGVYPLIMGDGALLSPEGTVVVDEITPGDVSTKQVMAVRLVQQPFSINQTWTQHIDPQTSEPIGYTGALNLANLRMLQFLAGSAERSTHLEVEVTSPSGNRVTHAQQKVKIRSEVIHAAAIDPAHFPEESAKYVHNRHQVTTLTGGGFTALDGVPTRNTPVGLLAAVEVAAGKVQHYRLEAGTDAESLPDVVRPLDYEAGTNEKVWKRKDAVVPSQTAFIDLGTLTGGGTSLVTMPEEARILTVRARINGTAPFFRFIELDKDSGQIGDVVFVQIEGNVSGTGTADVRMRHNGPYPTHYAMRLRAVASTVHGWFAFIKREESSQPWYYIGGCESAEYYSDPIFPISPSIPQKWYARLSSHLYELTDAPTVYTDLKESNAFKLTLTGNRTLNNPADTQDGHMVTWFIAQDNVGGRTLSYGSNFVNPPTIDTAPNAITMFTGVCMGGKVYCLQTSASALGLADGAYRETSYGGNGDPDADKLALFDNFGRLTGRGVIAQSPTNDTFFQLRDSNGDVVGSFSVQAGKLILSDSLNACAILEIDQGTFQALFDRDYAYDWVFGGNSIHFDLSPTFVNPSAVRKNLNAPSINDGLLIEEDFLGLSFSSGGQAGQNAWITSSSGGLIRSVNSEPDAVGIIELYSEDGNTDRASLHLGANSILLGSGIWEFSSRVRVPTLATATEDYDLAVGFADSMGAPPFVGNGVYFLYSRENSANWLAITADGGIRTDSDTGVPVSSLWQTLRIEVNADATQCTFIINGNVVATHSTNIPTAAGRTVYPIYTAVKTAGLASTPMLQIDACRLYHLRTTPLAL